MVMPDPVCPVTLLLHDRPATMVVPNAWTVMAHPAAFGEGVGVLVLAQPARNQPEAMDTVTANMAKIDFFIGSIVLLVLKARRVLKELRHRSQQ